MHGEQEREMSVSNSLSCDAQGFADCGQSAPEGTRLAGMWMGTCCWEANWEGTADTTPQIDPNPFFVQLASLIDEAARVSGKCVSEIREVEVDYTRAYEGEWVVYIDQEWQVYIAAAGPSRYETWLVMTMEGYCYPGCECSECQAFWQYRINLKGGLTFYTVIWKEKGSYSVNYCQPAGDPDNRLAYTQGTFEASASNTRPEQVEQAFLAWMGPDWPCQFLHQIPFLSKVRTLRQAAKARERALSMAK
jgi:hypothetical protein